MPCRLSALFSSLLHACYPLLVSLAFWLVVAENEEDGVAGGQVGVQQKKEYKYKSRIREEVHQWALTTLSAPTVYQLLSLFDAVSNQ